MKVGQPHMSGQVLHCIVSDAAWRCVVHSLSDSFAWSQAG